MPPSIPGAERLYWISLPYATFGIVVRDGIVVEAAPIARWSIGKLGAQVIGYYWKKGAEDVRWVR